MSVPSVNCATHLAPGSLIRRYSCTLYRIKVRRVLIPFNKSTRLFSAFLKTRSGSNALKPAVNYAWDDAHDDGHWYGELKTSATVTAECSVSLEGIPFPCHLHQWIMHPLALSSRFMPALASHHHRHMWIITGPAGCGKSTVAQYVAKELSIPYIEGDDVSGAMHPETLQHVTLRPG